MVEIFIDESSWAKTPAYFQILSWKGMDTKAHPFKMGHYVSVASASVHVPTFVQGIS